MDIPAVAHTRLQGADVDKFHDIADRVAYTYLWGGIF